MDSRYTHTFDESSPQVGVLTLTITDLGVADAMDYKCIVTDSTDASQEQTLALTVIGMRLQSQNFVFNKSRPKLHPFQHLYAYLLFRVHTFRCG